MKLLVTGGCGFIGSSYVRLASEEHEVVVLDKLTYAGRRQNLAGVDVEFLVGGIEDGGTVRDAMEGCDAVVNFAAESHVDRSISDQKAFALTHVIGTSVLLDVAREFGVGRFVQVSTDEVYGSIDSGSFTERSPLNPSSPYSATKAAGDLLVSAHAHTYGIDAVICRGSNNYGPRQYPEKLIPLMILNALHGDRLPVYGDGRNVRNWLYVDDFCRAIHTVLLEGAPGEAYNAGGPDEMENIEVLERILELSGRDESLIEYVTDRPGHDRRYSLSSEKLRSQLGWEPEVRFEDGLERTVRWYRDNEWWWEPIRSGEYRDYYERHYGRALGDEVDAIRRSYAAFELGFSGRDVDAHLEHLHPEVEWMRVDDVLEERLYRGHEGVRQMFDDLRRDWEKFEAVAEEIRPVGGGHYLVLGHWLARARDIGVELKREKVAWLVHTRDGRIDRLQTFPKREEALKAAEALRASA
jgi:dTDP-glucose 4,6-dehydratase